ncbi:MAG TPA: DUF1203 domain-containing protein [Thermoanaerobaculia bacterium]|nr:DUF1203 domain-containing protein [Thermoanaerobaculia bacterium]
MNVRIAPIPPAFLHRARHENLDALGQPVRRVIAAGGEPCRDVLRRAEPGEELILASFSPFSVEGPYREFGPVFILAHPQHDDANRNALPTNGYLRERFVLRAYSAAEEILDAELVTPADAETALARFFARDDVAFVHARFPTYGCFACRVDRDSLRA